MTTAAPTTTPGAIAARIREDIDEGVWAPGAALRQEELGERYGASRMPVREALQLLGAAGLVQVEPNRGAFVTQLSRDQVAEIFELRGLIEGHLLVAAVPCHDARSLLRLRSIQADLELEDSRSGWLQGDRRFHEALYAPAQRPQALAMALTLRGQVERYALAGVGPGSRRAEWKHEHRAILAAVESGDPGQALQMLTEHLEGTRALVLKNLPA